MSHARRTFCASGLAAAVLLGMVAMSVAAAPAAYAQTDGASSFDGPEILSSGHDLHDVDVLSGQVMASDVAEASAPETAVVADLLANDEMALDAQRLADQARADAEAKRKAEEDARRRKAAAAGQTEIGPDGCPLSAPENTLRQGSASVGIATICERSVAAARTPAAARAIKVALSRLGAPYSQPKRNEPGFYDCSSFITRAYQDSGTALAPEGQNAPTTYVLMPSDGFGRVPWSVPETFTHAEPGDMIFPHEGHVAMVLADGWMVHTNQTGDVSHVRRMYTDAVATRRVDPSRV